MYISLTGETGPVKTSRESVDPSVSARRGASARAFQTSTCQTSLLNSVLFCYSFSTSSPCRLLVSYSCTQPNNRRTTRPPLFCDPCLTVFSLLLLLGLSERERERGISPCDFVRHRWGHKCMCGGEIKRHIRHDSPERDGLAIDIEKMD